MNVVRVTVVPGVVDPAQPAWYRTLSEAEETRLRATNFHGFPGLAAKCTCGWEELRTCFPLTDEGLAAAKTAWQEHALQVEQ